MLKIQGAADLMGVPTMSLDRHNDLDRNKEKNLVGYKESQLLHT